jgi:hypothetical protein
MPDAPRPAPLTGSTGRVIRLAHASDPTDNDTEGRRQGPTAWASIFVSRRGNIGYLIHECPYCGYEHIHGGHRPPVDLHRVEGWRAPHCGCWFTPSPDDEYYLKLRRGPARLAPGAERSRAANDTCAYLRSIGVETSDEVIPSARASSWWRWR